MEEIEQEHAGDRALYRVIRRDHCWADVLPKGTPVSSPDGAVRHQPYQPVNPRAVCTTERYQRDDVMLTKHPYRRMTGVTSLSDVFEACFSRNSEIALALPRTTICRPMTCK